MILKSTDKNWPGGMKPPGFFFYPEAKKTGLIAVLTAVLLGAGADIASLRQGFGGGAQTLPAAGQENFARGNHFPLQGADERGTIKAEAEEQKFSAGAPEIPESIIGQLPDKVFEELYWKAQRGWLEGGEFQKELALLQQQYGGENIYRQERQEVFESGLGDDIFALGIRFLNHLDKGWMNAQYVKPLEGYQDIVCHGDQIGFVWKDADEKESNVSAMEFAQILEKNPLFEQGKPIRLLSCEAGKGMGLPAQYLADHFKVPVMAPTDVLFIYPDGEMKIGVDNNGCWKEFIPKEEK